MKICKTCKEHLPITCFAFAYTNKNRHINPDLRRNQCKSCKIKYNKERIKKDPDFYKKQYQSMSEEDRKSYVKRKSLNNQRRFKTNPEALRRKKIHDRSDRGIYCRYKGDCNRRGRKKRGIRLDLTFEYFSKLINSDCFYCGQENCRGVDRIDSSESYTIENSVPCCRLCNGMKLDRSLEEFKKHIEKIYKNFIKH